MPKAEARTETVILPAFAVISLQKPLKSCERITPELPLAPLKEPLDIALAIFSIVGSSTKFTAFTADIAVRVIFVPVSPSGTGNTLSSLILSF